MWITCVFGICMKKKSVLKGGNMWCERAKLQAVTVLLLISEAYWHMQSVTLEATLSHLNQCVWVQVNEFSEGWKCVMEISMEVLSKSGRMYEKVPQLGTQSVSWVLKMIFLLVDPATKGLSTLEYHENPRLPYAGNSCARGQAAIPHISSKISSRWSFNACPSIWQRHDAAALF